MTLCIDGAHLQVPVCAIADSAGHGEGGRDGSQLEVVTAPVAAAAFDRVHCSVLPEPADLDFSRVGLLRAAPECAPALAATLPWNALAEPPIVCSVRGGSTFLGTTLPRSTTAETQAVIEGMLEAGVRTLAIAAAGALANPVCEAELAQVARELDPTVSLVLSHELGGMGLREREASSVLNAALQPWARGTLAAIRAMTGAEEDAIFIARDVGGLVAARYFVAFPLVAARGQWGARLHGAARSSVSPRVLAALDAEPAEDGVIVCRLEGGEPEEREPLTFAGRACSLGTFGTSTLPAVDDATASDAVRALVANAPFGAPSRQLVTTPRLAASLTPAERRAAIVLEHPELIGCAGLAASRVAVETERLVTLHSDAAAHDAFASMRHEAERLALLAGAEAARIGEPTVEASPVAYLPEGVFSVRVRISERRAS